MAASKLFTPVVRGRPTATQARETAEIFMNPPTHAEVPTYHGPTDTGQPWHPLRLGGSGAPETGPVANRTFKNEE